MDEQTSALDAILINARVRRNALGHVMRCKYVGFSDKLMFSWPDRRHTGNDDGDGPEILYIRD